MKYHHKARFFIVLTLTAVFAAHTLRAETIKYFNVSKAGMTIVAGQDGALWYTHLVDPGPNDELSRLEVSGHQEVIDLPGTSNVPRTLAVAKNGDLWSTDVYATVIRRLSLDGAWQELAIPALAYSLTEGTDGHLWFTTAQEVGRLELSGKLTMFPIVSEPPINAITTGPDGKIWFADQRGSAILSIDSSGKTRRFPVSEGGWPASITTGPDGHLWMTLSLGSRIGRLSMDGELTEFELPSPYEAPKQIVSGPDGNLWFTQTNRIGRITPEGVINEFEIDPLYGSLFGLSFGADGNLWAPLVSYNSQPKILRMTLGGTPITGPCTLSDTILCIDDAPGDRRFQVEIEYETEQAGGRSGHGRAVPLSSLGVARGGLFWFFGADNPEIIVKILNGCATNQKYWAFISGGTNVGLIITVSDTVTGEVHTYYNRDLTPFAPIQDTRALSCGEEGA
jgi:streptogramin lyase